MDGKNLPVAYSYIRFSSAIQAQGDSYRRQYELSKQYAEEHNLSLDDFTYSDMGMSAFRGKNADEGALNALLTAAKEGRIKKGSYLLVESLDRLSRNKVSKALNLFLSIIHEGITLVTLTDQRVYSEEVLDKNPTELMVSIVYMMRAHEESETKSKRIKAVHNHRQVLGADSKKWNTCPGWLVTNADKTAFDVLDEPALTIRRIFRDYADGDGVQSIVKRMNRDKVPLLPKARSKSWSVVSVNKILKWRAVIGEHQFIESVYDEEGVKKVVPLGDPVPEFYPPIVGKDLFLQAQEVRSGRSRSPVTRGSEVLSLFKGLLKCAYCGHSMLVIRSFSVDRNGRTRKELYPHKRMMCRHGRVSAMCLRQRLDYESFEENFINSVKKLDISKVLDDLSHNEEVTGLEVRYRELQDQVDGLQERVESTAELLIDGGSKVLLSKLQSDESALAELQGELESLVSRLKTAKSQVSELGRKSKDLAELYGRLAKADFDERARVRKKLLVQIQMIVERINVYPVASSDFPKHIALNPMGIDLHERQQYLSKVKTKRVLPDKFTYSVRFRGVDGCVLFFVDTNNPKIKNFISLSKSDEMVA